MAPKLAKTSTPGIYRRHAKECARGARCDCAYAVVYEGKMSTFGTMDDAREGKRLAQRQAKLSRGHAQGLHRDEPREECLACQEEQEARARSDPLLHEYARAWVERYQGTGKRGFRDETRAEYRALLERYALQFFKADVRLSHIGPKQVSEFIYKATHRPRPSSRPAAWAARPAAPP